MSEEKEPEPSGQAKKVPSAGTDKEEAGTGLSPHAASYVPQMRAVPSAGSIPGGGAARYGSNEGGFVRRAQSAPSTPYMFDGYIQRPYAPAMPVYMMPTPMMYQPMYAISPMMHDGMPPSMVAHSPSSPMPHVMPHPHAHAMQMAPLPPQPVPKHPHAQGRRGSTNSPVPLLTGIAQVDSPSNAKRRSNLARMRESFTRFAQDRATDGSSVPGRRNADGTAAASQTIASPGVVKRTSVRKKPPLLNSRRKQNSMPNIHTALVAHQQAAREQQAAKEHSGGSNGQIHFSGAADEDDKTDASVLSSEPASNAMADRRASPASKVTVTTPRRSTVGSGGERKYLARKDASGGSSDVLRRSASAGRANAGEKGEVDRAVAEHLRTLGAATPTRSSSGGKKKSRKKGSAFGRAKRRALERGGCMHLVDAATGMCEQGALFQQLELLEDLMQREQIVGRTHVATVRGCNAHGLVVDVLIVDNSRLSPMTYDFNYRDENDPENYYCWRNALISWTVFPNALFGDTTDMEELAKHTLRLVPCGSMFKVYAYQTEELLLTVDDKGTEVLKHIPCLKMARRPYPTLRLSDAVNTKPAVRVPVEELTKRYSNEDELLEYFAEHGGPLSENIGSEPHQRYQYLVVIDFEATCDYAFEPVVDSESAEIIEFPWVVLDVASREIVHKERYYVRPDNIDGITKYCTALTGISKETCTSGDAITLSEALKKFDSFIENLLLPHGENCFCIVSDSVWDIQVQLKAETDRKGISVSPWFRRFIDVKEEFRRIWRWFPFSAREPPLFVMLQATGLSFVGRHHSGLDDCKTIAQLVQVMLQLDPTSFSRERTRVIEDDYDPFQDESWVSLMGTAPPDSWECPSCQIFNKPHLTRCNFCGADKDAVPQ